MYISRTTLVSICGTVCECGILYCAWHLPLFWLIVWATLFVDASVAWVVFKILEVAKGESIP